MDLVMTMRIYNVKETKTRACSTLNVVLLFFKITIYCSATPFAITLLSVLLSGNTINRSASYDKIVTITCFCYDGLLPGPGFDTHL